MNANDAMEDVISTVKTMILKPSALEIEEIHSTLNPPEENFVT